jgi:hypothetical protein
MPVTTKLMDPVHTRLQGLREHEAVRQRKRGRTPYTPENMNRVQAQTHYNCWAAQDRGDKGGLEAEARRAAEDEGVYKSLPAVAADGLFHGSLQGDTSFL